MKLITRYKVGEEVFYYDVSLDKIIKSIVTDVKREYCDNTYFTCYNLKSFTGEKYCVVSADYYDMLDEVFSVSPDLIAKTEKELLTRKECWLLELTSTIYDHFKFGAIKEYNKLSNGIDLDIYTEHDDYMLHLLGKKARFRYANGNSEIKLLECIIMTDSEIEFSFGIGRKAIYVTVDNDFRYAKVKGTKQLIVKIENV